MRIGVVAGLIGGVFFVGLLAGTAAHDIGTPLTNLAVILDDWQDLGLPDPQERARQIALMQEAIATCRESLSHMLAMGRQARVEAAHPADPVALLREVAARWQARYPEIDLVVEGDGGPRGQVLSDVLLTRTLTNLLDNAREAGARRIVIAVAQENSQVAIRIRDEAAAFPSPSCRIRRRRTRRRGLGKGGTGWVSSSCARSCGASAAACVWPTRPKAGPK